MVARLGWLSLNYGANQVLRLVNNLILTRLLSPPIFGLMAVVMAIRTGFELLSDVGVSQNIVSNPRGEDPDFYNTAWTLQVLRGFVLASLCLLLSVPLARFFDHPELGQILPVAALFFLFTGFDSTARGLLQKRLHVARMSLWEIGLSVLTLVAHVGAALVTRSVWALLIGTVITGAAGMIISYLYIPGMRHRFIIDRESALQLLRFGKWIFFSSIVYFFAMNFDRLYFAKQISLSQLGVYGIARGLADMFSLFVARASTFVLFPTVAAAGLAAVEVRQKMLRGRKTLLLGAAVGIGVLMAMSDLIVNLLYDERYREAGLILPILCVGAWFSVLTSTNDSILLGLARPAYPAWSNAAKLLTYLVGVPVAFYFYGFFAAVAVLSAGEVVKYFTLWAISHKEGLHFGRQDVLLTLAFVASAVGVRILVAALGLGHETHHIALRALFGL
jgi:O-antigen/teichoic acid export membrane protein